MILRKRLAEEVHPVDQLFGRVVGRPPLGVRGGLAHFPAKSGPKMKNWHDNFYSFSPIIDRYGILNILQHNWPKNGYMSHIPLTE